MAALCLVFITLLVVSSIVKFCECELSGNTSNGTVNGSIDSQNASRSHHEIHVVSWNYDYVGEPLLISLFIVAVCAVKILFKHARLLESHIPESCLLIILGIAIGLLFLVEKAQRELAFLHFNQQTFFLYLLPPIILQAAYSLKDKAFVESLGAIMLYAVVGTILNVLLVGGFLYGFYVIGWMGSLKSGALECLLFSTVIAAVDPVAVLAIFEQIGVNKMLYFMVFGESLFNDAVTIVVYNNFLSLLQIDHIGFGEICLGLAAFLCVSIGGMAIGFFYGFLTAFCTKYTSKIRMAEPVLFFGLSYLSYISAELFHFSGIISIICCGLIQSHYAADNISSKSYISIYYFSEVTSGVAESLIFIILGVMLVAEYKAWLDFNAYYTFISLLLCIAVRFAVVFGLAYIVNTLVVSIRKIRLQEQFIMAYGGLRGAITFSLVFMLDPGLLEEKEKSKNVLFTSAYLIIFFTTFLQGISIKPLVKKMRIRLETKGTTVFKEINLAVVENTMAGLEEIIGHRGSHYWAAMTKYLSNRFLRPAVQKYPHRRYSSFFAAYQAASMQDKYAGMHRPTSLRNLNAMWTELDEGDKLHQVTALDIDRQDAYDAEINKGQAEEARKAKVTFTEESHIPLETPRDLLTFRDLLMTPPHKTMHYISDLDSAEERKSGILRQILHLGRMRMLRYNRHVPQPAQGSFIQRGILQGALVPLGLFASDHHAIDTQQDQVTETASGNDQVDVGESGIPPATRKRIAFTLESLDAIDDDSDIDVLLGRRSTPRL